MRTQRFAIAALGALALGACASFLAFAGQKDVIRFTHENHGKRAIECISCHETIYDATTLADGERHMPAKSTCLGCHKKENQEKNCAFCHSAPELAKAWEKKAFTIKIDHVAHLERTEEDCKVCHKTLPEPGAREGMAPPMSTCLGCHQHRQAYEEGRCDQCHESLRKYPLAPVAEFAHAGDFVRRHGTVARVAADSCADCHDQNFCAECHATTSPVKIERLAPERVERNFIHRGDWLSRHPLESTLDSATCERCHATSYCQECHAQTAVGPGGGSARNPHPPNYSYPGPTSHAQDARRDIATCAACHEQGAQTNCLSCHRSGGVGGSPHPAGWSSQHPATDIATNGMCTMCHR